MKDADAVSPLGARFGACRRDAAFVPGSVACRRHRAAHLALNRQAFRGEPLRIQRLGQSRHYLIAKRPELLVVLPEANRLGQLHVGSGRKR